MDWGALLSLMLDLINAAGSLLVMVVLLVALVFILSRLGGRRRLQ